MADSGNSWSASALLGGTRQRCISPHIQLKEIGCQPQHFSGVGLLLDGRFLLLVGRIDPLVVGSVLQV